MLNVSMNASGVVVIGKGYVTDCIISADGADATVSLYDGKDTAGKRIGKFIIPNGYSLPLTFKTYPRFDYGLYVEINADTTFVNIGCRDVLNKE